MVLMREGLYFPSKLFLIEKFTLLNLLHLNILLQQFPTPLLVILLPLHHLPFHPAHFGLLPPHFDIQVLNPGIHFGHSISQCFILVFQLNDELIFVFLNLIDLDILFLFELFGLLQLGLEGFDDGQFLLLGMGQGGGLLFEG
jgi:hypothetical protein